MAFLPAIGAAVSGAVGSLGGAGTLFSALGSVVSAGAGLASGVYQSNVAKANAEIAKQNAVQAAEQGRDNARQQDNLTRAAIGEQIAVQSASGLSLNSGSQILTRKAARALGRQDSINAAEAGNRTAYNYNVDAANQVAEGKASMFNGITSGIGGLLKAGSLIGDARSTRKKFDYTPIPTPRPSSIAL
jgi:Tfp pilus assembly protein FimV